MASKTNEVAISMIEISQAESAEKNDPDEIQPINEYDIKNKIFVI